MIANIDGDECIDSFQLKNNTEEENNESDIELDVFVLVSIIAYANYFLKYIYKEPYKDSSYVGHM